MSANGTLSGVPNASSARSPRSSSWGRSAWWACSSTAWRAAAGRECAPPPGRWRRHRARRARHGEPPADGDAHPGLVSWRPGGHAFRRRRRGGEPTVHWQDRLAQMLLLACCCALALFLLAPLGASSSRACRTRPARSSGCAISRLFRHAGAQSRSGTRCGSRGGHADHRPARIHLSRTRSRARACPAGGCSGCIALTPILAPSLLAAISFIQWFGNQGLLKGMLGGARCTAPSASSSPRSTRRFRTR